MFNLFCVDAFTARAGAGNPAGVCLLSGPQDPAWMQMVAREMSLPETAFLYQERDGFQLRWFTPRVEVDLCGHATLAAAHVLWQEEYLKPEESARFFTKSGTLTAVRDGDRIELDLPEEPDHCSMTPEGLMKALGVKPLYVGKNRFDYLVEVESEQVVRNLQPDFALLASLPMRGVIVTSRADSDWYDFVSRFFAPALGVNEDPVTGSAHCCLAPFWEKRLHKRKFLAYQASERGGILRIRTGEEGRVILGGQAVTVWNGTLAI